MKRDDVLRIGKLLLAGLLVCWEYGLGADAFAAEMLRPVRPRTPQGEDAIRETYTPGDVVPDEPDAPGDVQPQGGYTYLENPDRDVWVFDARFASITKPDEQQFQRITVQHFMQMHQRKKSHWKDSTIEEFLETYDTDVPLIVLVHGNYTSKIQAIESANMLENKFFPGTGKFADARYRLLVWVWPAETVYKRHLPDARLKGYYATKQGEYLAHFLSLLPEGSRVSLVGFSFGARTTCEAVQHYSKNFSEEDSEPPVQIRNLLLSPAVDQYSLAPQSRHENVLAVSQQSIVLFNSKDFALLFYPVLSGCGGPHALGRTGVPLSKIPADLREKITGINIQALAKKKHSFVVFFRNPDLNRKLGDYLLFE